MMLVQKGSSLAAGYVFILNYPMVAIPIISLDISLPELQIRAVLQSQRQQHLKLGTASKGLILAADKTSKEDWYKVTLTKTQAVTVSFDSDVNGDITLAFYSSDK